MEVGGETLAAVGGASGVVGLGWFYLRAQLAKVDSLSDRVIRLETLQAEKVRECQQHKIDTDAKLAEGKNEFASIRAEIKDMNNKLTQLLVIFREHYTNPNDTQTLPRIPLDTQ